MPNCEDLLARARAAPTSLRFTELCQLAECNGFVFDRQKGSHRIYKKKGAHSLMNFQNFDGKAKAYQVRQLLAAIDAEAQEDSND